jgi:hypothetical protein
MKSLIIYIIVIGLAIYAFIMHHRKYTGANAISLNKGYRSKEDSNEILFSRIKWVNGYKNRVNYSLRYIIYAVIITALLSIIIENVPSGIFLQMVLITWLALYSMHNYFHHHADKYAHYYIHDNIRTLQKRLKLKDVINLPTNINNDPLTAECHNFTI